MAIVKCSRFGNDQPRVDGNDFTIKSLGRAIGDSMSAKDQDVVQMSGKHPSNFPHVKSDFPTRFSLRRSWLVG
jgi:hypothetical protein